MKGGGLHTITNDGRGSMIRIQFRAVLPMFLAVTVWAGAATALGQDTPTDRTASVTITPDTIELAVGERAAIRITVRDAEGNELDLAELDFSASTQSSEAAFDPREQETVGLSPGTTILTARVRKWADGPVGYENVRGYATVIVRPPATTGVEILRPPAFMYAGTRRQVWARASGPSGNELDGRVTWQSSDGAVARVSQAGIVSAEAPGSVRLTAAADGVESSFELTVRANPIRSLSVEPAQASMRVGDPVRLAARPADDGGRPVGGAVVEWRWTGLSGQAWDALQLDGDEEGGAVLVANESGPYLVTASIAGVEADVEVEVFPRPGRATIELIAHGVEPMGQATTDLWVFEGQDGRDYAYTGTYHGNHMYAWDVTDPASPTIVDSLEFDGRRVNDVKINADRTIAVVTSEHASDRRNGITVLDISAPSRPVKLSHYAEGLTGGVHNTWIEGDLVYAVHYGTRALHIIDISDPRAPTEVGRWQLENEDRFLHDVMIEDGLAYLSYWNDGVVILDVGAGIAGGTPTEPQLVSSLAYTYRLGSESYGNTHHAIRYGNYVFTGDEIFDCAECVNGPRGYIHAIDVSDIENPREVAWYRVPEAGSHNMWAEDDRLYIGYYQAGLRVVDISGELYGDLYRQGREIGWYMTQDGSGSQPNSTDTWGVQPYKGFLYASDPNSGLWVVRLIEEPELHP
jgi:hypothetical protein